MISPRASGPSPREAISPLDAPLRHPTDRVVVHRGGPIGRIAPEVHGHFAEHLGRCIYDGLWVGDERVEATLLFGAPGTREFSTRDSADAFAPAKVDVDLDGRECVVDLPPSSVVGVRIVD